MDRPKGKRALITGATSGIGLETAQRFASEGARLAITGKDAAALESAREKLGAGVLTIASDASDAAAQMEVADAIRREFGALDALFVNAGMRTSGPFSSGTRPASIERSIST